MPHWRAKKLPPDAERFPQAIALTHAQGTLSFSRSSLHHLHRFLRQAGLEIHQPRCPRTPLRRPGNDMGCVPRASNREGESYSQEAEGNAIRRM